MTVSHGAVLTVDPFAEAQFRVMIECIATDVSTMMVNVTETQGQVETDFRQQASLFTSYHYHHVLFDDRFMPEEVQLRVMIECIATDVATMMVNVTEIQDQVEKVSGSRL